NRADRRHPDRPGPRADEPARHRGDGPGRARARERERPTPHQRSAHAHRDLQGPARGARGRPHSFRLRHLPRRAQPADSRDRLRGSEPGAQQRSHTRRPLRPPRNLRARRRRDRGRDRGGLPAAGEARRGRRRRPRHLRGVPQGRLHRGARRAVPPCPRRERRRGTGLLRAGGAAEVGVPPPNHLRHALRTERSRDMKKILNTADDFVKDTMEGVVAAYGDRVSLLDGDHRVLVNTQPAAPGKVAVVTAGGSGHLPLFLGYVGDGLLDGCAVGEVFASPSSEQMADMIRACDQGAGVLALYGNYNGDLFNFRMACEDVEFDDIETRQIQVRDDVASSPKENAAKRRGVAGLVYAYKIAGAAAAAGMTLDEVTAVTEKALENIRSMGVALSPC